MNNEQSAMKEQIELSFETARRLRSARPRTRRPSRAHWWFSQMRRVVDGAFDWQSGPAPRPEQTYLGLARGR